MSVRPRSLAVLLAAVFALIAPDTARAAAAPDPAKVHAAFDAAAARLSRDPATAKAQLAAVALDYARIASADGNSDLARAEAFFNAGVAHHLIGNMGEAVLAYRRAEAIDSTLPGLANNLARARATVAGTPTAESDGADTASSLLASAHALLRSARPQFFAAALAGFVLTWLLLGVRLFLPRVGLIWPALTALVTLSAAAAVLWPAWHDRQHALNTAVVVRTEAAPRLGPDPVTFAAAPGGMMRPGTEFTMLGQRVGGDGREWVKVSLRKDAGEGTEGLWVPRSTIEPVLPD